MSHAKQFMVHPTAELSPLATVGQGAKIWNYAQIREGAQIGPECIIGKNVYVDFDVHIGARCKIQNNSSIYHGSTLEEGVFIGPHVILTNDLYPRAITPAGNLKGTSDWIVSPIHIRYGASLGAGVIVLPGVTIGRFALVGSGAVVTRDVPDYALVAGNPARIIGWVDETGRKIPQAKEA